MRMYVGGDLEGIFSNQTTNFSPVLFTGRLTDSSYSMSSSRNDHAVETCAENIVSETPNTNNNREGPTGSDIRGRAVVSQGETCVGYLAYIGCFERIMKG